MRNRSFLSKGWSRRVVVFCLIAAVAGTASAGPSSRNIGPTGIKGVIAKGEIRVAGVEKGSPADGKLANGDVIVGIGDAKFKGDIVRAMAVAIDAAETEEAVGKMALMLKDKPSVELQLRVLGSYSPTAPYNCAKTDKIVTGLAESLLKSDKLGAGATKSSLLGLMATGEKKYMDAAYEAIREGGLFSPDMSKIEGYFQGGPDLGSVGWHWGYNLITLGEYYLLTGDESVLPAMRIYAVNLARGQDAGGLWGHRLALHGRLHGYAQMNQPSLSSLMGMLFAKKCGIDDPVLDKGIATTYAYVVDHVGKGSFPYGVHNPQPGRYNNNGTSGSAAICMALNANTEGARFFAQLSATTYDDLEKGHASSFFNPLWTPLGANLSGPEVTQQFFRKSLWFHNLRRKWDGGYEGDGKEGAAAGVALLNYSLPRKALVITGRAADQSIWVEGEKATDVVMRSKVNYEKKSIDELIALLDDPIPQIPYEAVKALGRFKGDALLQKLSKVIETGSEQERRNALAVFKSKCSSEDVEPRCAMLGEVLTDKDQSLRVRIAAASALGFGPYGETAHPYYMDILRLLDEPRPGEPDPFGRIDMEISYAAARTCGAPFEADLVMDKDLLYRASLRFMDHKRQEVRGCGTGMLVGMPPEDFHIIADRMIHVLDNDDPGYHSYHNAFSTSKPAIKVLASLGIKEGMDYMLDIIMNGKSKWGFRYRMVMENLPLYGGNARPYIPKFEAHPNVNKKGDRFTPQWQRVVKAIEEDANPRKLTTLEEVRRSGHTVKNQ